MPPPNSFDEWTTLKEVVVGAAEGYGTQHLDSSFKLLYLTNIVAEISRHGP